MNVEEEKLVGGGRTSVFRRGHLVLREGREWSKTVLLYLKHLEAVGFEAAPRVVGNGFDDQGREVLTYIDGNFVHPHPWPEEALHSLGQLLRRLHKAGETFRAPPDACWSPWYGRPLGGFRRVYGHCDTGPWNIVANSGTPVALIDWDTAGPVDALIELGQTCWLNAQLHDDDVATVAGLGSAELRARHAALIADGYELPRSLARRLVQAMIDVAIADAADQAIAARVTSDSTDPTPLWGLAWRARAAAWMARHRAMLVKAIAASLGSPHHAH